MDLSTRTISEIKDLLSIASAKDLEGILTCLESDKRSGIQQLIKSCRRKLLNNQAKERALFELTKYERNLQAKGFNLVAGVDEAGRGALAGPLIAAAVILPKEAGLYGLRDSKQLSPEQREVLFDKIIDLAISWQVFSVEHSDIDKYGIQWANLRALEQAVLTLRPPADFVLSDAFAINTLEIPNLAIIKGDTLSLSIAAASVVAKVTRDRIMCDYHEVFPEYGFDRHKGYGTQHHLEAMAKHGISEIHRKCFSPVTECEQLGLDLKSSGHNLE